MTPLNNIKISVIVPTYTPGSYIYECLRSLLDQTIDQDLYEIIIIVNGPKHPFYDQITSFLAAQTNHFIILYSSLANVSNARNLGIERAKGDYICFVDDDDLVSRNYLKELYKVVSKDTLSISNVYSFTDNIDACTDDFFICSQIRQGFKWRSMYYNRAYLAFPVAKMIPREIIGERRFNLNFKHGEDSLFMTTISDKIEGMLYTSDDVVYYVRKRIGSATRRQEKFWIIIRETLWLIIAYITIYIKNIFQYNFFLFLSRIPACVKNAFYLLYGRK